MSAPARHHFLLLAAQIAFCAIIVGLWSYGAMTATPPDSTFQSLGLAGTSVVIFAHPLGLAAGAILWLADVFKGPVRLFIRAATIYFAIAMLYGIGGIYLMASLIDMLDG